MKTEDQPENPTARTIDEAEANRRLDTLIMVSKTTAMPVVKNIIADREPAHGVPADRLYADPESGGLFARTAHGPALITAAALDLIRDTCRRAVEARPDLARERRPSQAIVGVMSWCAEAGGADPTALAELEADVLSKLEAAGE